MQELRTARLILDAPREADIDAVLDGCQDPETQRWIPLPSPYTRENAEYFVRSYCPHGLASGRYTVWALRERETAPLIGVIEVRRDEAEGSASLGCWSVPWARGRGLSQMLIEEVEKRAKKEGFSVINLDVRETQEAAVKLYERLGYTHFGTHPNYAHVDGKVIAGRYYFKAL